MYYAKWHFSVSLSYATKHFRATERNCEHNDQTLLVTGGGEWEDSGRTKVQGFCNCSRRLSYFGVRKWLFAAVEIIRVALEFSSVFCLSLVAFHLGQNSKKVPTYATELFVLIFIIDICNSLFHTQNASSSVVEWLGNLNRHPCSCGPC